jgi:hypothetical protein
MDDVQREIYLRARGLLDQREAHERAYQEWEDRRRATLLDEETDELIARARQWREQRGEDQLIFKTFENPPPRVLVAADDEEQPPQPHMDDETQALWNAWLHEHLGDFAEIVGSEMGRTRKQLSDDLSGRLDEIEARLDLIEDRLDELDGGGGTQRVVALPKLELRGRDAA